jgi:hypothetical protein
MAGKYSSYANSDKVGVLAIGIHPLGDLVFVGDGDFA